MVSMVIILFLVAVIVSLFAGRLAEIILGKLRDRAAAQPEGRRLKGPARGAQ